MDESQAEEKNWAAYQLAEAMQRSLDIVVDNVAAFQQSSIKSTQDLLLNLFQHFGEQVREVPSDVVMREVREQSRIQMEMALEQQEELRTHVHQQIGDAYQRYLFALAEQQRSARAAAEQQRLLQEMVAEHQRRVQEAVARYQRSVQGAIEAGARLTRPVSGVSSSESESPEYADSDEAEAVRLLLEEWMADESGYDEETWLDLKASLDQDRPSNRKLFVD